jgi:hypothetical protein
VKTRIALIPFALIATTVISVTHTPSQTQQPGPEVKRLQFYAGTWSTEYEMKQGDGKMTTTDISQMTMGGFFLVTHTDGKGFMGELKSLAVMGYDARSKQYTYDSYNNFGEADHYRGTVQGDTWTWTGELKSGANTVGSRFIAKEVSPRMYTMKLEMMAGGKWVTVMEGKSTKTK